MDGAVNFADLLGVEPVWERCACGTMSSRVPCADCVREVEAAAASRRAQGPRGIPPRYRWARLDAPELAARVSVALGEETDPGRIGRRLAASEALAVLLVGPAGAGKTSLAVAAMREVRGAVFVPALELERARIAHRAGDGEAAIVELAISAPLLVIDDLGQDRPHAASAVGPVIAARHDAERRTWVTTGLDAGSPRGVFPELEARYGAGIVRRLTERGTGVVLSLRPRVTS